MDTFTTAAKTVLGESFADSYVPTPDQLFAIRAEERRLDREARATEAREAEREAARAAALEADPLAERRALAEQLRQERQAEERKYEDAIEIVRHEHGSQIPDSDPSQLDRADLYRLAYGEGPPTDAELANDIDANFAAANRTRPKWEPNVPADSPFIADLKAREGGDAS